MTIETPSNKIARYVDHANSFRLTPPRHVNVLNRPAYNPPPRVSTREGSEDYKQWPSKHF